MKTTTTKKIGEMAGAAFIMGLISGIQFLFFETLPPQLIATMAALTPFVYHAIKTK